LQEVDARKKIYLRAFVGEEGGLVKGIRVRHCSGCKKVNIFLPKEKKKR